MAIDKYMKILAIETSCDETAAAVIGEAEGQPVLLSSVVASQVDLHAKTGGVVPEVASRAHMEAITPVVAEALLGADEDGEKINFSKANEALGQIDYIAYTAGPGLIGSLLVGYNAAKAIAFARNMPIIPVNHIEGHIYSVLPSKFPISNFQFPIVALTVSGGHTSLTLMTDHGKYENLGQTLDDAAGEAFDKVARLLDLGYPGGPAVSKLAAQFRDNFQFPISNSHLSSNDQASNDQINEKWKIKNEKLPLGIVFPRPILNDGTFNFSFSGLKTAVLQKTIDLKKEYGEELPEEIKSEICCAFEDAVVDVLVTKTMRAAEKYQPKSIILAGGVAANKCLRETLKSKVESQMSDVDFLVPEMKFCGDNAAMIGLAAYYHVKRIDTTTWDKVSLDSNLELI